MSFLTTELSGQREISGSLNGLSIRLDDNASEMREAATLIAGRIDEAFTNAGSLVPRLADATVRARAARVGRGETLVAGSETPLRAFGDSIRLAATATTPGVTGSAFQFDANGVTVGVDFGATKYMRAVLLGDSDKPERNVIGTVEANLATEVAALMDAALSRKLAST